jgi:hypothetical protein
MPRPHPDERPFDGGRHRAPYRPHQWSGDGFDRSLGAPRLVERTADPKDRRKVLARVRENKIEPIAARGGDLTLARITELNDGK